MLSEQKIMILNRLRVNSPDVYNAALMKLGMLAVNEEQAKIVRRIFGDFLSGHTPFQIAKRLTAEGIPTPAGKDTWSYTTVRRVLSNEKYIGDALLQKTYTVDFLNKKRVKNEGIMPQYYVEGSHEGIVPRDLFMQAQEELIRRSNLHSGQNRKKRVYSSKYALSSIVYCSKCGEIYRRIAWNNRGKRMVVWRCCTRVEHGPKACDADTIKEEVLQEAVMAAINQAVSDSGSVLPALRENIEAVIDPSSDARFDEIQAELLAVQQELTKTALANENYDELTSRVKELMAAKQDALAQKAVRGGVQKRIQELMEFLEKQPKAIEEYDEQLVRQLTRKITVYGDRLEVELKAGITVDVRL